jgi:hypothetical protein
MAMLTYGQPMMLIYKTNDPIIIRLSELLSLIFFVFLLLSCSESKQDNISIIWTKNRPIAVSVPKSYLNEVSADSIKSLLSIQLQSKSGTPILGEYSITDDNVIFKPEIPFSRGLTYEVLFRNKQIGIVKIPLANAADAPVVVAVYPTQDTLPENLLKLYLQFSRPMREGESQKYISLLRNQEDTVPDVFLNLQPELWNEERTELTIWLDPGRIKRDLIPNQQMGNPLQKGEKYSLVISNKWTDVQGLPLKQSFARDFIVGARDSISPDPDRWNLKIPKSDTDQPLEINTFESLDFFLLTETVRIFDKNGNKIPGELEIENEETKLSFIPQKKWTSGPYLLRIDSHLEDLAGNNLNKLFDRDVTVKLTKPEKMVYERTFVIGR